MDDKLEKEIQDEIFDTFGAVPYMRIWRINCGKGYGFWQVRKLINLITNRKWGAVFTFSKTLIPFNFCSMIGHADISGLMYDGIAVYIEVKRPGQKQRPDQITFENVVKKKNGIYILAYSVNDVYVGLTERGYKLGSLV
jgi:hypothetical protein